MKFATIAFAALVKAQDDAAPAEEAASFVSGDPCKKGDVCGVGLCCADMMLKDDVVDGEISDSYLDNLITVCNAKIDTEYTSGEEEEYWASCLPEAGSASKIAAGFAAIATVTALL